MLGPVVTIFVAGCNQDRSPSKQRRSSDVSPVESRLSVADDLHRQGKTAEALKSMGVAYSRTGRYDRALELYEEGLQIARTQENQRLQAAILSNIGNLHYFRGELRFALKHYEEARAINLSGTERVLAIAEMCAAQGRLQRFVYIGTSSVSGRRTDLVRLAREKMRKHPDRYVPHIYGEKELGGTAWMYLSGMSFEKIGFPKFGYHPVPGYTEPIQHALFKWFLPPLALYGALGGAMWLLKSRNKRAEAESGEESTDER